MLARRNHRPERSLTEVMDQDVVGERDPVALAPHPHRVVVVLEQREFKPLIDRPHQLVDVAAQGDAEHREHGEVDGFRRVLFRPRLRVTEQLVIRPVGHVDLGLGRGLVARRTDEPDRHVLEVIGEPG